MDYASFSPSTGKICGSRDINIYASSYDSTYVECIIITTKYTIIIIFYTITTKCIIIMHLQMNIEV